MKIANFGYIHTLRFIIYHGHEVETIIDWIMDNKPYPLPRNKFHIYIWQGFVKGEEYCLNPYLGGWLHKFVG